MGGRFAKNLLFVPQPSRILPLFAEQFFLTSRFRCVIIIADYKMERSVTVKANLPMIPIAVGLVFAMILALSVSLVGLSSNAPPDPGQASDAKIDTPDTAPTSTESLSPPQVPPTSGLRFTKNGDGTCILSGLGDCTDACVVIPAYSPEGDRVTEIAALALYGCSTVTAIQIPSTVTVIGNLAFANCPNLVYISVSEQNQNFRDIDGVLYSADEKTLILYPALRAGSTAEIRPVTKRICDMAFYNCQHLSRVLFSGTAEEWECIAIGTQNYSLTAAAKSFGVALAEMK